MNDSTNYNQPVLKYSTINPGNMLLPEGKLDVEKRNKKDVEVDSDEDGNETLSLQMPTITSSSPRDKYAQIREEINLLKQEIDQLHKSKLRVSVSPKFIAPNFSFFKLCFH